MTTSSTTNERPWPDQWPDWLGNWSRLTGRQRPEFECWHPGDESEGDAAAKFGVKVGIRLLPWQWMVVRAVSSIGEINAHGERQWTHRVAVLECSRQQGKTLLLTLLIIRRLFKDRRRLVYTAQQWATVEDVFDRVIAVIERTPSLRRRLASPPSKAGNRGVIVLKPLPGEKHVVKANFGPRTRHFARGFTEIDDLILDEAYDLVPAEVANLTGAQAASANPQTIYASTPPVASQHPYCHRFSGLVRTVEAGGAPGLYGALYRAPKTFTRGDTAAYPLAQPSYGVVGDDREMAAHLQGAQDAGAADLALFDADWLGWGDYPPPENGRPSEIPADQWQAMADPDAVLTGPRVVVLTREKNWAITAAQRTGTGRIHVEVGWSADAPAAAVVRRLVDVLTAWNPAAIVVPRGAAAQVLPELEAAGIEAVVPNRTEEAQACGGFLSDALSGSLSHSGQQGLADAIARAYRQELPSGGFVWQVFDAASHAQLVGATLARWALLKFGSQPRRKTVAPRTLARSEEHLEIRRNSADFDAMTGANWPPKQPLLAPNWVTSTRMPAGRSPTACPLTSSSRSPTSPGRIRCGRTPGWRARTPGSPRCCAPWDFRCAARRGGYAPTVRARTSSPMSRPAWAWPSKARTTTLRLSAARAVSPGISTCG